MRLKRYNNLREDLNSKFELEDLGLVEIHTEMRDYRSGQSYLTTYAKLGHAWLGHVDWSEYKNEVYIEYVNIKEEYRRKKIATKLFQTIKEQSPGKKINYGATTELGSKFLKSYLKEGFKPRNVETRKEEAEKMNILLLPVAPRIKLASGLNIYRSTSYSIEDYEYDFIVGSIDCWILFSHYGNFSHRLNIEIDYKDIKIKKAFFTKTKELISKFYDEEELEKFSTWLGKSVFYTRYDYLKDVKNFTSEGRAEFKKSAKKLKENFIKYAKENGMVYDIKKASTT